MTIKIPEKDILEYLNDVQCDLIEGNITFVASTVEECEVPGTWTFKLTYKWVEDYD